MVRFPSKTLSIGKRPQIGVKYPHAPVVQWIERNVADVEVVGPTPARRARKMRAEKDRKFVSDQFEPKVVHYAGFDRTEFRWWRNSIEDGILRATNMGVVDEILFNKIVRTPVEERASHYQDNSDEGSSLSVEQILLEVERILM